MRSLLLFRIFCFSLLPALLVSGLLPLEAFCLEVSRSSSSSTCSRDPGLGLFVASSGLGDRGFMDSAYNGLLQARQQHQARLLMETQPRAASDEEQARLLQQLADKGACLVICPSASMKMAMDIAARNNPQVHFVLLDSIAHEYLPNVSSVTFATEQAAFLAGALAAKMSRKKVLGVIGGAYTPAVQDFVLGYEAGARHVVPGIQIEALYIESHAPDSIVWSNPETARQLAALLHTRYGADILFPVAGASGFGVFNYVKQHELYAIGVDTDQDYLVPGRILTSVLKRLDMAVHHIVDKLMAGSLDNRNYRFTLSDKGVELSNMRYTRNLIPTDVRELLDTLRQAIISGKIIVPSCTAVQATRGVY